MHLLNLSFGLAVRKRVGTDTDLARSICLRQLTGIAGVAAERIRRALGLPADRAGLIRTLELHPLLNPSGYVVADLAGGRLHVSPSPAHDDGAWIALCGPGSPEPIQAAPVQAAPIQAIATAVDPLLRVRITGTDTDWTAEFERVDTALAESVEVAVTKVSRGAAFEFQPRRSLPLTVL